MHCYIAKSISGFVAVATTAARAGVSAAVALQRSYCHLWMSVHCQAYGRWIHITGFFCWLVSKKCIIWRYTRLVPLRDVWWQPCQIRLLHVLKLRKGWQANKQHSVPGNLAVWQKSNLCPFPGGVWSAWDLLFGGALPHMFT